MYNKTFGFLVTLLFATVSRSTANDQECWIKQAEKNAKKDLSQWPGAVDVLETNPQPVKDQIMFFQSQVNDSVDNMNSFVPKLMGLMYSINSTAAGDPNIFRRTTLRMILWFVRGKRDNKSYYLLDAAVNWVSNRVSELSSKEGRAADLAVKLTNVQKAIADLRDQLDSEAQNYVKCITEIDVLSIDIAKNIVEIRSLASGQLAAFRDSSLLKNAEQVNDVVKAIIV